MGAVDVWQQGGIAALLIFVVALVVIDLRKQRDTERARAEKLQGEKDTLYQSSLALYQASTTRDQEELRAWRERAQRVEPSPRSNPP